VDPTLKPEEVVPARPAVPTVAVLLDNALSQFQFVPRRPASETEFKTDYAKVAVEAGLTIGALRRMIAFVQSVPDDWSQHGKLANTPQELGIHAMNLDLDVGPLLQTQKLMDSVVFVRCKGLLRELSAAELEMMNLTGDGSGFDMISMPIELRGQIPTSNFFQRTGYERNPVAIRNNTVAKLLARTDAKMDSESSLAGAKELAALCDAEENRPTRR